jgi:type IV pilus assembly protein PilX
MMYNKDGEGASMDDMTFFYRVTAVGFGMLPTTQVALQTFYRKESR